MTVEEWLKQAQSELENAGIGTARLDVHVLLSDQLHKDRTWLVSHGKNKIPLKDLKKLNSKLARRKNHAPLAYIRNKTEFYGREFYIDERVLEPRPETETMIEHALEVLGMRFGVLEKVPVTVVDIGTGSGAIAVTMKLERPKLNVLATDIDLNCLKVARKNAKKHRADIQIMQGNLLEPLPNLKPLTSNLVILANLPYVPDTHPLNKAASNEPRQAIFGGPDGLDLYRRLFEQSEKSAAIRDIFTEALPPHHEQLKYVAENSGFTLQSSRDFIQYFKRY